MSTRVVMSTYGGFVEVIGTGDPLEVVAEFLERVGKTLDVTRAVVEEKEAHGGDEGRVGASWRCEHRR